MLPSACWWFSIKATIVLPTAKEEPFKVCANWFLIFFEADFGAPGLKILVLDTELISL